MEDFGITTIQYIAFYSSESTRTEPVMQLILDRDEYDYDEYDADGKQLYLGFTFHS